MHIFESVSCETKTMNIDMRDSACGAPLTCRRVIHQRWASQRFFDSSQVKSFFKNFKSSQVVAI